MLTALVRNWWVVLVRGILGIVFGLAAFAWPGITLLVLVVMFGAYCIADGIVALLSIGKADEQGGSWGRMLFVGIISIAVGVGAFIWPGITTAAFLIIIAAWAIVRGIFEIVAAIQLRKVIENEWLLGLAGVVAILFGVALIVRPGAGALALIWLIATFALIHGVLLVVLAFKLRGLGRTLGPATVRG